MRKLSPFVPALALLMLFVSSSSAIAQQTVSVTIGPGRDEATGTGTATLSNLGSQTRVVLSVGAGQGFEQILLQRNAVGPAAGEVLDTYVYFKGIVGGQWGITAAAGLIKGIFGTIVVIGANKLAHRAGQEGIYS